jgi:hypothetical protein
MHELTNSRTTHACSLALSLVLSLAQLRTSHDFLDQMFVCIHGFSQGLTDAHTRARKGIGNQTCSIIHSLTHSKSPPTPHACSLTLSLSRSFTRSVTNPPRTSLDQLMVFVHDFCEDFDARTLVTARYHSITYSLTTPTNPTRVLLIRCCCSCMPSAQTTRLSSKAMQTTV